MQTRIEMLRTRQSKGKSKQFEANFRRKQIRLDGKKMFENRVKTAMMHEGDNMENKSGSAKGPRAKMHGCSLDACRVAIEASL